MIHIGNSANQQRGPDDVQAFQILADDLGEQECGNRGDDESDCSEAQRDASRKSCRHVHPAEMWTEIFAMRSRKYTGRQAMAPS